jgi:hypothetical protein
MSPASLGEAVLELFGDSSRLKSDVDKAKLETAKSLQNIGACMQKAGGVMTAAVTGPLLALGVASIDAASDFEESLNKVRVVFGDASDSIVEFSETAAENLGISEQQALSAAGTFGNIFVAMGLGVEPAAEMSQELLTLAADLASFNNMDPTEVLDKLRAGLVGETEPLRALGVNLNAAAVEAKALELGLVPVTIDSTKLMKAQLRLKDATEELSKATRMYGEESDQAKTAFVAYSEASSDVEDALAGQTGELTAAQKAQASYALIMEQTATAQGDFARTSDGLANSTRIVKAQLGDAAAQLGSQLLPYALQAVTIVRDLVARFTALSPEMQKTVVVIAAVAAAIGPLLVIIGTLISSIGAIIPVVTAVAGALTFPLIAVIAAVVAAVALLYAAWTNNWGGIRDKLTAFFNGTIVPAFERLQDWLEVVIPAALEWLKNAWETVLWPAIQQVRDWVVNVLFPTLQRLWDWLATNVPAALKTLSDFWTGVLWPAIQRVRDWINAHLVPLLVALADLVGSVVRLAVVALAVVWENVLKPALEAVWGFIQEHVLPIFNDIWAFIQDNVIPVIEDLADWVGAKLKDNFEDLVNFLKGTVFPVFEDVRNWVGDKISGAFDGLTKIIQGVKDWVDKLALAFSKLKVPPALTPGSPTPFEIGLRGITDAMEELTNHSLAQLSVGLDGANRSLVRDGVAGSAVDGGPVTNNYFDLTANYPKDSPVSLIDKVKMLRLLGVS